MHDAAVLSERVGRVALLAELRDAMRHEGERSLIQFKLSHEASLLRQQAAGALHRLAELRGRTALAGVRADLGALQAALGRAEQLFAACDSPL